MSLISKDCIIRSGKYAMFVAKEGGKKYTLLNPDKLFIEHIRIDGCVIPDKQKACDFLFRIENQQVHYFVEMKGGEVVYACEQILNTYQALKKDIRTSSRLEARIVCKRNNVPKFDQMPDYIKLAKVFLAKGGHVKYGTNNEFKEICN